MSKLLLCRTVKPPALERTLPTYIAQVATQKFPFRSHISRGRRRRAQKYVNMVLACDVDLLNPPADLEKRKHKLKRLVQSPNSYFMDVKCQGCFNITTVFSHSQKVVECPSCHTVLCTPTGGKTKLTFGCSFRRKAE